jgi:large conductance mechanosensitive channel
LRITNYEKKKKEDAKPAPPAPTPPDIQLLTEIRDLLKK